MLFRLKCPLRRDRGQYPAIAWSGAGKSVGHEPVEAHVLFGGFAGKAAMNL